jgi:hypothetical protein
MEITELQCNEEFKRRFQTPPPDFYKLYLSGNNIRLLRKHNVQTTGLFESEYYCEQFFSRKNIVKNISRNRLDGKGKESCFHVATYEIRPDVKTSVTKK